MAKSLFMLFIAVFLGVCGQLALKVGMSKGPPLEGISLALFKALLSPYVLGGLGCYGLSSLLWLVVLSREDLSYAYPMIAIGYVVVVFLSWLLFHEPVPLTRIGGLVLICAGVVIYAFSRVPTEIPSSSPPARVESSPSGPSSGDVVPE